MTDQAKSAYLSSINWISFCGGAYAFIQLMFRVYETHQFTLDVATKENLFYFTACVAVYVRRTYFPVKPVYMTKKGKEKLNNGAS